MKIGIIGNYGHDNNGDEAILQGIINQLVDELSVDSSDIVIFSNNPDNTMRRYGLKSVNLLHKRGNLLKSMMTTIWNNRKVIQQLDLLIIGGGGLLMDMYKRDAPLYTAHALLGKLAGCKVVIYGVGAGPLNTKLGKFLIKLMLKSSYSISVRDDRSKELLHSIGVSKPIQVISDPAMQLGKKVNKTASEHIRTIGITAVPYYSSQYWPSGNEEKYRNYIMGMARNIDHLIEKLQVKVTFFSTKFPQDVKVTEDIYEQMERKENVEILKGNLPPDVLVSFCKQQDIIIGTRLHSLILSVAAKTPIIGIGYHQKVYNFLKRIKKEQYYVDIDNMNQQIDLVYGLVNNLLNNWIGVQKEFAEIYLDQKSGLDEGKMQIQKALE